MWHPFTAETAETCLRNAAEQRNISAATLIHPLRLAVTGFSVSPDIFTICEMLGKENVHRRLETLIRTLSRM
ncbi:MAG: hypothetical protein U5N26_06770 [Candidatus Marinimicrobia bacterium]|nr:hypothetical protein [Candidatus Neomarinimicrobiota bacterium]